MVRGYPLGSILANPEIYYFKNLIGLVKKRRKNHPWDSLYKDGIIVYNNSGFFFV